MMTNATSLVMIFPPRDQIRPQENAAPFRERISLIVKR